MRTHRGHGDGAPRRRRAAGASPRAGRCPLPLWRTVGPDGVRPRDVTDLARAVGSTAILHERRWEAARNGDAAAAAAVAIDRLHRHGPDGPVADLVMGNLVVLARRDGDATAPVILAHALRALARRRADGSMFLDLAAAWSRADRHRRSGTARGRRP